MVTWPKHQGSLRGAFATGNAIVHQGRLDPGVRLLTKPYRKSQLANMVRRALTG